MIVLGEGSVDDWLKTLQRHNVFIIFCKYLMVTNIPNFKKNILLKKKHALFQTEIHI